MISVQTYTVEDKNITVPNVPEKEHYTGAWESCTLNGGNKIVNAVYVLDTFNVTWKNYDGTVLKTETVDSGTMPSYRQTPTKNSDAKYYYTFIGWIPEIVTATQNAEYVARYSTNEYDTYTITYDANGGTGAPSQQKKSKNSSINLSETVPTNGEYVFMGWSCLYEDKTYQEGASFTLNANVTLYAIWGHT